MKSTRKAYGEALVELGKNHDFFVLDADLSKSTMTNLFKEQFPERFINCGIAESNMIGVAAGLASCNNTVFASTFAMFAAGRAYEQIRNSVAYCNLDVKIAATHSGITVGEDGASHQCIEDLALMRVIPNVRVLSPSDAISTKKCIEWALFNSGPFYIRLGRVDVPQIYNENSAFEFGKGILLKEGSDLTIIATGIMVDKALKVSQILESEYNISVKVVDIHIIKPIDEDLIIRSAQETKFVVTLEEHSVYGGLGSTVSEILSQKMPTKMLIIGIQDQFGRSGTPDDLLKHYQLDEEGILKQILDCRILQKV